MSDIKARLLDSLEILRKDRQAQGDVWKVRAYSKAIRTIKDFEGPITTLADVEALKLGKGAIAEKAIELLKTGHIEAAEVIAPVQQETAAAIDLLEGVAGIGQVKARELVAQGIKTIEALRANEVLLNDKQKIGLKYYEDFQARIPRAEMDRHATAIATVMPPGLRYAITGSYRRKEKDSGDIDVLLCSTDASVLTTIVESLQTAGYLYETLAKGDKKYMGVCKLKRHRTFRRFDLITCTPEAYPYTLLYFTGSATVNILMRNHALARGYSLSEYGLKPTVASSPVPPALETEADIFAFLGLAYMAPEERTKAAALQLLQ
jgi:DNA polymerase beta